MALKNDYGNIGLGSLSSFDYIDYVLRKGPYDPFAPKDIINGELNGHSFQKVKPNYKRSNTPNEKTIFGSSIEKQNQLLSDKKNGIICEQQYNQFDNLKKFEKTLKNLLDHKKVKKTTFMSKLLRMSQSLSNFFNTVDDTNDQNFKTNYQNTIFHKVIADMKKNQHKYKAIIKVLNDTHKELQEEWNKHIEKFKDSGAIGKWWHNEGEKRAQMQLKYDLFKKIAKKDLTQYTFNIQVLKRLESLKEFNDKATPEQKKKYIQILNCEWDSI